MSQTFLYIRNHLHNEDFNCHDCNDFNKKIISSCKGGEIGSKSKHDLSILIVESWMDKENGQFKKNEYNGEAVFES